MATNSRKLFGIENAFGVHFLKVSDENYVRHLEKFSNYLFLLLQNITSTAYKLLIFKFPVKRLTIQYLATLTFVK